MENPGSIVITGFMGCGKTEVARHLAQRLNIEMADLDEVITQTEGRSPALLISEEGERIFRTIETSVLSTVLNRKTIGVIALGGGAWIESLNRDLIAKNGAISVWLDTPFEICWERIAMSSEDRPLGKTKEQASELYQRRLSVYELAAIRIEATREDDPDRLAYLIQAEIAKRNLVVR